MGHIFGPLQKEKSCAFSLVNPNSSLLIVYVFRFGRFRTTYHFFLLLPSWLLFSGALGIELNSF